MGLETGSFIDDLVITNPPGTDAKSEGDDHLRLVKKVIKATFPGMAGAAWRVQEKSGAYTVVVSDNMTVINCTAVLTLTLTAAATLGNQHIFLAIANGGEVIIDPNVAETINGAATLTVPNGSTAIVVCNGTLFLAFIGSATLTVNALTLLGNNTVTQAQAEAGTETVERAWTALRVAQAIAARETRVLQATQAAIEAETNEDSYAPPDLIRHNPGVAKVWAEFQRTGTIDASLNVNSITDNGVGNWTVHLTTNFSSLSYCITLCALDVADGAAAFMVTDQVQVGSFTVYSIDHSTDGTAVDPTRIFAAALGDQ